MKYYHIPDIKNGSLSHRAMRRETVLDHEGSEVIVSIRLSRIGRDPSVKVPGRIINFQYEMVEDPFDGMEYGVSEVEPITDERARSEIRKILRGRGFEGEDAEIYF